MNEYTGLKRKHNYSKILLSTIVLFFIGSLVGCSNDVSVEPGEITSKVAGRIQTDTELKGIPVQLKRMDASGNIRIVSNKEVFTDDEGKFTLETNLDGTGNLLIHAEKDSKVWRGILTADVKPGITVYSQPLSKVTTVSADIYESSLESGRNQEYTQIRLFIDEKIADILDSNRVLLDKISNAVAEESDAEKETFLRTEIGGTTSQWQQIIVAKIAAQTALDRDLYYALSKSTQQAALNNYLCTITDAYVDVGLQSYTFSKVLEASIRTFLKEVEGINSRLEFEFLKRTSLIRARILNASILSEFQKLGADPSMINDIIYAGETLQKNLYNSVSAEDIADGFTGYHEQIFENLVDILGVYGNALFPLRQDIAGYKSDLISEVVNSPGRSEIISAYITFYENIKDLVAHNLNSGIIIRFSSCICLPLGQIYVPSTKA